ncbi:NAD(P)/FAD-dependent oxidoreductase [Sphingobium sp. JS3065]|uniref:flavin-containing monooxygenase n=1 Tax=Sphingobium sp. JS3065 TaxID=2970925 RepID=UPI00226465B0|nr:NAD(P)/FAD-dependent oxidoreductase [Sphingobium sp. JS3065]UZW56431.1 NAD(P)/FAD-dependent oxidoreductase [Sphingobium sp. JS3065]
MESNIVNKADGKISSPGDERFDAVVVGAGFSGMYMLHKLRKLGLSAIVIEAGPEVGGVWYWNRYPGARCDVESIQYQYGFSEEILREWTWSERYPSQAEINKYQNYVADKLELRRDIRFNTRVMSAYYDEASGRWVIQTDRGEKISSQFCIMATGNLSVPRIPDFPGLETFEGATYHTHDWPSSEVNFAGKRVAVIGTGSSGAQVIPEIGAQAGQLTVFQRTANYCVSAFNGPLEPGYVKEAKAHFFEQRKKAAYSFGGLATPLGTESALELTPEEARNRLEGRWDRGGLELLNTFYDLLLDRAANDVGAEFVKTKMREKLGDPELADLLIPKDYPLGAKRPCLDAGYLDTFKRPNVRLIDVNKSPIERVVDRGVIAGGVLHEFDAIVFATGFDAMTGALSQIDIRGRKAISLRDEWSAGPRTLLGLMVAGFPNFFNVIGPGSPSVLTNNLVAIEQHVEWIADCIGDMKADGISLIEARRDAQDAWVDHVNEVASRTLLPAANSWYLGANVPGKPRVFMPYTGGLDVYRRKCEQVRANGYEGFTLTKGVVTQSAVLAGEG